MPSDHPVPIVLDCDPGHDDALALLLAHADPAVDLRAVTVVHGNQTVDKCLRNALAVCTLAGITDVPVARGADAPLTRPLRLAPDIHGETGLDGPELPEPVLDPAPGHAVDLLARTLRDSDEPVTVVATGALTNVALLLRAEPALRERMAGVVWMGGSTGRGNITPYAEANAANDPEAAQEVLDSGVPFTMVGLDTTHQALVTRDVVDRLEAMGTTVARTCAGLMTFFADTYREAFGMPDPPLHDPVAVARVLDPTLVPTVRAHLVVETEGRWTAGATVVDLDGYTGRAPNADVAQGLDRDRFLDRLLAAVASYR
ncbi:nucleoside hydrolase [Aquipuribacter nitratireducens]|uniref:Nucleoside hydrolase n=1 Tax=Aquipuribacter nitratireducens TaxID=650104 RepID=A0ABW0GMY3_9MICO